MAITHTQPSRQEIKIRKDGRILHGIESTSFTWFQKKKEEDYSILSCDVMSLGHLPERSNLIRHRT